MRHRAPRPLLDLRYRVPRAAARLVAEAARPGGGRMLVAVLVVLSLGTAAYAAVGSMTGSSSTAQAGSAGATASRGEPQRESRASERPPLPGEPRTPGHTPSVKSSASTPTARQSAAERRVTASPTPHNPTPDHPTPGDPTPQDNTPPKTSLSAEYPTGDSATFSFSADEPASFTCSLDGAAFTPCDSPTHYANLASGWHTFAVRAVDAAGNVDPSPAQTRWHAEDRRAQDQ